MTIIIPIARNRETIMIVFLITGVNSARFDFGQKFKPIPEVKTEGPLLFM